MGFLVPPSKADTGYCIMRGSIPPGISVPLHSHPEQESFYILSGVGEVYALGNDGFKWREVKAGDMANIPCGMRHAWRNVSDKSLESVVTTNPALGRFFLEVGRPIQPGPKAGTTNARGPATFCGSFTKVWSMACNSGGERGIRD